MNAEHIFILLGALAIGAGWIYFIGPFPKRYRIVSIGPSRYEVQVFTYIGLWREAGNDYWVAHFDTKEEAEACIQKWMNPWKREIVG